MNILVVGKMGSGKSQVATYLCKNYGYKHFAIAQWLKDLVHKHYNLPKDVSKGHIVNGKPVRQLYQEVGEKFRQIDRDWHIDELILKLQDNEEPFIIDDIRMKREIEKLSKHFECTTIMIESPEIKRVERLCLRDAYLPSPTQLNNTSEIEVDMITDIDFTIVNDGSIADLEMEVDEIIDEIR